MYQKVKCWFCHLMVVFLFFAFTAHLPVANAEVDEKREDTPSLVDFGTVNIERLVSGLKKRGIISEEATPDEIQEAVDQFLAERGQLFTREPEPFQQKLLDNQKRAIEKNLSMQKRKARSFAPQQASVHTDHIAVALIEFPDRPRNAIPYVGDSLWTEDFDSEHYQNMLFNMENYQTTVGVDVMTMAKYYYEQSGGTWAIEGEVTPWTTSVRDAAYYGANGDYEIDEHARELVIETLSQLAPLLEGQEAEYDQRDPYDSDGDGVLMEADGMLDNLMVVHSGIGEETGEDDDAIWSHRWQLIEPVDIPGTTLKAYDYMIQPEDGATGVFAHEYGHNLGLPDLYDTTKAGYDSPVGGWSLMSTGGHMGEVFQTKPAGFDPGSRMFLQKVYGGKWIMPVDIPFEETETANTYTLKEASDIEPTDKVLKINLPDIERPPATEPFEGDYSYYSDMGDYLSTTLTSPLIDLNAVEEATLSFDSFRDIEVDYDYLSITVRSVSDEVYTEEKVWQYSDTTVGEWVHESLELTPFLGKTIQIEFKYETDEYSTFEEGVYLDNIQVTADDQVLLFDDAEGDPLFELDGFIHFDGKGSFFENFYLVELRSHNGVDEGLRAFRRNHTSFTYDPGIVIWYVDTRFKDNDTSMHPGYGLIGVVDAHQQVRYWNSGEFPADSRYQVSDAAFGLKETTPMNLDYILGTLISPSLPPASLFHDSHDYRMDEIPDVGKILPQHGLAIEVKTIADDYSTAQIEVSRTGESPIKATKLTLDSAAYALKMGETKQIFINQTFNDGSSRKAENADYHSSNPAVARVTNGGTLIALAEGTTEIQATVEGLTAKAVVTVFYEEKELDTMIPLQQGIPIRLTGGTTIDLGTNSVPHDASVKAVEVDPVLPSGMSKAGPVLDFTFNHMEFSQPVRLSFPYHPDSGQEKLGIFYLREDGTWEHQASTIENGYAHSYVQHFSTYGVFEAEQATSPVTNVASGSRLSDQAKILLSSATPGVKIYYTLDGSEPTTQSLLYTNESVITVPAQGLHLKAIAAKENMRNSNTSAFIFTSYSPSGGGGSSGGGSSAKEPIPMVPIAVQPVPFTELKDVQNHWAKEAIGALVGANILKGYPDETFRPEFRMTRAEFVTALVKVLQLSPKKDMEYPDAHLHWARNSIGTAASHGIITGDSKGNFRPNDPITREQMAVMIAKAIQLQRGNAPASFTDQDNISEWAEESVRSVASQGLMKGYQDQSFKPKHKASRAEVAAILVQLAKEERK